MINIKNNFNNASDAYNYFYTKIATEGFEFADTRALFNVGFTIKDPIQNQIHNKSRDWNITYAEREWNWYLSGNPNAEDIAKKAPIWYKMMDSNGCVRSNYGWQWNRNNQIDKVIAKLETVKDTRHAAISIYDGKEIDTYAKDTPCTYAIQFTILYDQKLTGRQNPALNMAVLMRSNDLWYGFCNDQYCFSMLQKMIAERLSIEVGTYYHFAHNLHIYNDKLKF
tara:strand:- start:6411 stop:7082 length:672 start_codon:yes stop_codon:yes gene_type:complete